MSSKRIQDIPNELRPREKLLNWGASSLSDAELIAIFLRVGVQGSNAIEVGQEVINRFGSLRAMSKVPAQEIAKVHGVGLAKSAQIVAAVELGTRIAKEINVNKILDSPQSVEEVMQPLLQSKSKEHLYVLLVDVKLQHLQTHLISQGTINSSVCHPRDVLHPAVIQQAWGFILVHNHPSGDPAPSTADDTMTKSIDEAANILQIRLVDHIIIGSHAPHRDSYYSYKENNKL